MRVSSLLLCLMVVIGGCVKAKEYVVPSIDSHLQYSASQVGDMDGEGLSFTIPGHSLPLVDGAGEWDSRNKSDMIWLGDDRIVFVKDADKVDGIYFFNAVSGDIYPCEDEIQHQEVRDAVETYRLNWVRTTDRELMGGAQFIKKLSVTGACTNYNEFKATEVKSADENHSFYVVRVDKFVGVEVEEGFTERILCDHREAGSYCGILESRASATNTKIGACPGNWASLSRDGRYMLSDAGLLDVKARKYVTEGAIIEQGVSTPPVLLTYAVSPTFEKVAILYGYSDHYVVDIVEFSVPTTN